MRYKLDADGRTPVAVPGLMEWARWYESADRTVRKTDVNGVLVSTVFLGIDHRFAGFGPPILFETMIFGGEHDEHQDRCATWDEAIAQHEAAIARAKGETE
jgi:hypothetical protein